MNSHLAAIHRFAFIALLLAGCSTGEDEQLVGTLERDRIELPAELSEPVTALRVREGTTVAEGDILLQLDDRRARAERERLAALRDQARRRLDEQLRGPRAESIRETRARLAAAEAALETAGRELDRVRELRAENLASTARQDVAQAALDRARGERDALRATLEAQLEGSTVEELDQARAQLAAAEAALSRQEILLERLTIRAPQAGRIEALPWKTGSQPPRGAAVAVMLATGAPYARVHIPNGWRDQYLEGAAVTVEVDGFGSFNGRVRWVAGEADFTPYFALTKHDRDRLSHAAEIELTEASARSLPTGVPVSVRRASGAAE